MTRDDFTTEFARGMRFVLQKHEREIEARAVYHGVNANGIISAKAALEHATTMTDAAIQQVADHCFDAFARHEVSV